MKKNTKKMLIDQPSNDKDEEIDVNDLVNKVDEGDYFYVSKKLLEKYYDSKYRYTMKDFKFDFFVKNFEEIKLIF